MNRRAIHHKLHSIQKTISFHYIQKVCEALSTQNKQERGKQTPLSDTSLRRNQSKWMIDLLQNGEIGLHSFIFLLRIYHGIDL